MYTAPCKKPVTYNFTQPRTIIYRSTSDTPSMLRLLEAIRQENKREREEIRLRLERVEAMVGRVLERQEEAAAAAPASSVVAAPTRPVSAKLSADREENISC